MHFYRTDCGVVLYLRPQHEPDCISLSARIPAGALAGWRPAIARAAHAELFSGFEKLFGNEVRKPFNMTPGPMFIAYYFGN